MKKKVLTIIIATVFLSSCKKQIVNDNPINNTASNNGLSPTQSASAGAKVINDKTMADYLTVTNDPDHTKVNTSLYAYMVGMKKVFETDRSILQAAVTKASQPFRNGIFLDKFICGSGACKILFNSEVCTLCSDPSATCDHCAKLASDMIYKDVTYGPTLFLYNAERANLVDDYYLALGSQVQELNNDGKIYIPAWHIKKNGDVKLELIDRKRALDNTDPVFIFGNTVTAKYNNTGTHPWSTFPPPPNGIDPETFNPTPANGNGYTPPVIQTSGSGPGGEPIKDDVISKYCQLFQHYEATGWPSEYYISFYQNGLIINTFEHLVNVPKNYVDCGCLFSLGNTFLTAVNNGTTFDFVTYEFDWYATKKVIGLTGSNITFDIFPTFANEWYVGAVNQTIGTALPNQFSNIQYIVSSNVHAFERL